MSASNRAQVSAQRTAHMAPNPSQQTHGQTPPGNTPGLPSLTPQTNTTSSMNAQEEDETEEASDDASAVDIEDEDGEQQDGDEDEPIERPPSPSLREISSLASWTVSTYKPGCGVKELLSPSILQFWQSDGPQPHLLTIHFFKVVSIVRMRIYLDLELDESYTPTRMVFAAGMGEHDLVEFAEWKGEEPSGWVEVELDGVGGRDTGRGYGGISDELDDAKLAGERGRDDGKVLRCMCVQIRVLENHQNGKDTHVRGVQLFARDERLKRNVSRVVPMTKNHSEGDGHPAVQKLEDLGGLSDALLEPEWARDIQIR